MPQGLLGIWTAPISDATTEADDDSANDDVIQEALDLETQKRLWLRSIIPLLQTRSRESDRSGRVQLALDLMIIAACERVARLMRSDLAADKG